MREGKSSARTCRTDSDLTQGSPLNAGRSLTPLGRRDYKYPIDLSDGKAIAAEVTLCEREIRLPSTRHRMAAPD